MTYDGGNMRTTADEIVNSDDNRELIHDAHISFTFYTAVIPWVVGTDAREITAGRISST